MSYGGEMTNKENSNMLFIDNKSSIISTPVYMPKIETELEQI